MTAARSDDEPRDRVTACLISSVPGLDTPPRPPGRHPPDLAIDGHRLMMPAKLARLVCQLRDQDEQRWTLGRLGTPVPWLFPGQSPDRPAADVLIGVRLHRYGIDAHAGRNTARLA